MFFIGIPSLFDSSAQGRDFVSHGLLHCSIAQNRKRDNPLPRDFPLPQGSLRQGGKYGTLRIDGYYGIPIGEGFSMTQDLAYQEKQREELINGTLAAISPRPAIWKGNPALSLPTALIYISATRTVLSQT